MEIEGNKANVKAPMSVFVAMIHSSGSKAGGQESGMQARKAMRVIRVVIEI